MTATATSNYIEEAMRATVALAPPSLANNPGLLARNLLVMSAAMCLGLMMAGKQARRATGRAQLRSPHRPGVRLPNHHLPRRLRRRGPRSGGSNQPMVVELRRRRHDSADLGTETLV
jgi:hypothetical protein